MHTWAKYCAGLCRVKMFYWRLFFLLEIHLSIVRPWQDADGYLWVLLSVRQSLLVIYSCFSLFLGVPKSQNPRQQIVTVFLMFTSDKVSWESSVLAGISLDFSSYAKGNHSLGEETSSHGPLWIWLQESRRSGGKFHSNLSTSVSAQDQRIYGDEPSAYIFSLFYWSECIQQKRRKREVLSENLEFIYTCSLWERHKIFLNGTFDDISFIQNWPTTTFEMVRLSILIYLWTIKQSFIKYIYCTTEVGLMKMPRFLLAW